MRIQIVLTSTFFICSIKVYHDPINADMILKRFVKNINDRNRYFAEKNFDFRSEKEWRYVCEKKDIEGERIFVVEVHVSTTSINKALCYYQFPRPSTLLFCFSAERRFSSCKILSPGKNCVTLRVKKKR